MWSCRFGTHLTSILLSSDIFLKTNTSRPPPKGAVSNSSSSSIDRIFTQWFSPFLQCLSACPDHIQSPITSWEWPDKPLGKALQTSRAQAEALVSALSARGLHRGINPSALSWSLQRNMHLLSPTKSFLDYLRTLLVRPLKQRSAHSCCISNGTRAAAQRSHTPVQVKPTGFGQWKLFFFWFGHHHHLPEFSE